MNPVKQGMRTRAAAEGDDLLETMNREVLPVLTATRDLANRLAANEEQSSSATVDWSNAHFRSLTLTGDATLSFVAPGGAAWLALKVTQGGGHTVTWPSSVKWEGGTPPVITVGAGAIDVVMFYCDGSTYFGLPAQDFS